MSSEHSVQWDDRWEWDNYKAVSCARETLSTESAGVSRVSSTNALPLFSTYGTTVAVNGDGCPAQVPEGTRAWGDGAGTWQGCSTPVSPCSTARSSGRASSAHPTALTWWLLQARSLSLLLNLTSLEIIALMLLILIARQDVFIAGFSLS